MVDDRVIEGQPAKIDGPPKSKTGDTREQEALNQVWNAKQALKTIRDEQKDARARMRVHEAGARFLVLRYIIRKLKMGGGGAIAMEKMLNDIAGGLEPRDGYAPAKVEVDKNSLKEIIKEYKKK